MVFIGFIFHFFCPEQNLSLLDFIDWCTRNYSSFERVIMDATKTKNQCLVIPLVICDSFAVPSTVTQIYE